MVDSARAACRYCEQTSSVYKHGRGHAGHPRYRCRDCNKTFQLNYAYRGREPGVEERTLDMLFNGAGIRRASRAIGISTNTVLNIANSSKETD
ncbi:IS1-like element transposase [Dongshaea marina]|uniref:IS1-like element transposase n=1 Tax=Dongshaea marina TaxID=2047966 RepID=UPI00131ED4D1|nr:IS1-like element transposase [Dongshaea marina]